jgi:hypothetical protein
MSEAMITYIGLFDMRVCVPWEWTDEEVTAFANEEHLCGTTKGWTIRKQSDYDEKGFDSKERVQCEEIKENCHIMLDA